MKEHFNFEIGDIKVKGVAEKIGSLFGENGRIFGKLIDYFTQDITIKVETDKDDEKDESE